MPIKKILYLQLFFVGMLLSSCSVNDTYSDDFDALNNRTWVNSDIWTIPIENWRVQDGRVECTGKLTNMKAVLLKYMLINEGDFLLNVRMGLNPDSEEAGSGGVVVGMQDQTDMDIKSLAYFGSGINIGVDTEKNLFIGEISKPLPDNFDISDFSLHIDGQKTKDKDDIRVQAIDKNGIQTEELVKSDIESF